LEGLFAKESAKANAVRFLLIDDAHVPNNNTPSFLETAPSLRHPADLSAVARWNNVDAIAKSRPHVVIAVFESVRARPADGRTARKASISSTYIFGRTVANSTGSRCETSH